MKELKREGKLSEALQGAASLAQDEINHLMSRGYPDWAAREVALKDFILLPPEGDGLDDWEREEIAEMEREYQKNPPVVLDATGSRSGMLSSQLDQESCPVTDDGRGCPRNGKTHSASSV